MFKTPFGNPASEANLTKAMAVTGVSGDGFTTIVHPAANAAAAFRRTMATGKFQGTSATATPSGCLMVTTRLFGADGIKHVPWIRSASPANHEVNVRE
ncbi:hypothetical protein HG531_000810 [Fusarium graminearum]|nr:hypothetical protein HG531_000810 [Fusarium graminearum]